MNSFLNRLFKKATTIEKSEDHLTSCHSLVSILRFLHYSDILNCRLVNNRINEVIQKNRSTMPRKKISMQIIDFMLDEPIALVCVSTTNVNYVYSLTHHRITIWESRYPGIREVDAHFSVYGVPFELDMLPREEAYLLKIGTEKYGGEVDKARCYRISSIQEGLRTVVRILFRQFHFTQLNFSFYEAPEEFENSLLNVLSEEFRGSGSICSTIVPTIITPSVIELLETTGCRDLSPYMNNSNFRDVFPKLPLNKIDIMVLLCEIDTFDEIVELIRGMQSRSHSVFYMVLKNAADLANYHHSFLSAIKNNFDVSFASKPSLLQLLFGKNKRAKTAIEIVRHRKVIKIFCRGEELHLSTKKVH